MAEPDEGESYEKHSDGIGIEDRRLSEKERDHGFTGTIGWSRLNSLGLIPMRKRTREKNCLKTYT